MRNVIVRNDELIPEIGKIIEDGKDVVFRPKGVSMLPFIIGEKDCVLLRKVDTVVPGDIVLAKVAYSKFVLHRVERIEGKTVILMGDGNIRGNEKCKESDILAIAVKIIRGEKEIDCQSSFYRFKSRLWRSLLPVRRYLLAFYKRIIL
jgi:SOS-response transcriptional repressor LexA